MAVDILQNIAAKTRERIAAQKETVSTADMAMEARQIANAELVARKLEGHVDFNGNAFFSFPFLRALSGNDLAFICEVKKASPSKGIIADEFDPVAIAKEYERAGAAAISCLTEPYWFLGKDEYLSAITKEVSIPILRKDFVVDEYMIYQAKVLGASAILLIAAILDDRELASFHQLAESLGLSVLVEAHDENEIERALAAGARIVGVNNRNLRDFSVSFDNAQKLRDAVPEYILFVAESGVSSADDVVHVASMDADGVLVGEALMRSDDKDATLSAFKAAAKQAAS